MSSSAARRPAPGCAAPPRRPLQQPLCRRLRRPRLRPSASRGPAADPLEAENERLRGQVERLRTRLERAEKVIAVQGNVSALLRELSLGSADPKDGR